MHKDSAGKLAVVGVFFEVGDENKELAFFEEIPKTSDEQAEKTTLAMGGVTELALDQHIDVTRILENHEVGSYYTFPGSLTTPPCSEGFIFIY